MTLDILSDEWAEPVTHHATPGGIDRSSIGRLVDQLDGGHWDPEDPHDFKKFIRLVAALISVAVIANLFSKPKDEVEGWRGGEAPKGIHPVSIFGRLKRLLKRIGTPP